MAERETLAQTYLHEIAHQAEQLAVFYNKVPGLEAFKVTDGIKHQLPHVLLEFAGRVFWGVRPSIHNSGPGALEFIRLESPDGSANYDTMTLTRDSIVLDVVEDTFVVILHQEISKAVRANVTLGFLPARRPLHRIVPFSIKLLERIIEYELLPKPKTLFDL